MDNCATLNGIMHTEAVPLPTEAADVFGIRMFRFTIVVETVFIR